MQNQTNFDATNHGEHQLPTESGAPQPNEVNKLEEQVQRLADLPVEERKKAIKQFYDKDWVTNARADDFIDAVDTVQKWCLGQIVAIDDNQVTVRFDGWSNKYDSTYRFTSSKIAPFRKCSKGYTGQIKTQLRVHMNYNQDIITELKTEIEGLISNEFRGKSAYELTQFLRGKVFVYVDFVLSQVDYTEADFVIVNNFLKTVIKLIIAWMKHVPTIQQKALADYAKDSDLQLVDEDIAVFQSCGELMTTLQSILCGCHRTLKYYLYCDQNQKDFVAGVVKDYQKVDFVAHRTTISPTDLDIPRLMEKVVLKSQDLVYGVALDLLSSFHKQGGFDAFFSFLKNTNTRPLVKDQNGKMVEDEKFMLLPLEKLGELTGAFANCKALFDENFAISFVDQVHNVYKSRFLNITDKELKEIDKDTLSFAFSSLKAVLSLTKTPKETAQVIEEFQLLFVQRHLKTSYLEKRLQGVGDLRNLIEQVDATIKLEELKMKATENGTPPSQIPTFVITANNKRIKPTIYLTQTSLKNWMIEMQISDNLFGEGAHPELLKRAAPIIKFLCEQSALTQETVEAVWRCQQGKHEATVRIVYNLINEIVEDLPQELFDVLHQKIVNVSQEEFTEMHLQFLKEFTIKAYAREESKRQITDQMQEEADIKREKNVFADLKAALDDVENVCLQPGQKLYGLPIYWRVLQDSFKCNDLATRVELFKVAQESMIGILNLSQARSALMYYMLKCINNLYEGQSLYPSITLFQNILSSIGVIASQQIYERDPLTTHKAICQLEMQLGLVHLVMQVVNHYDNHVKETVKNLSKKGKPLPDKIEKFVFAGCSEHNATLEKIFEFLEFVVLSSNWTVVIQTQNLQSLFKTFVHSPNFLSDQVLFLQFINKKRQKQSESNPYNKVLVDANLLTGEEQKHLFSQILCNPEVTNYVQLTSGLSKCFQTFFKLINQELGYLEVGKRVEVFNFESLIGMDSLWRIAVECSNEKVRDVSRDLLIDLHLRLNNATFTSGDKERVRQIFIDRCMSNLQSGLDRNARLVTAVVKTLSDFLDRYDGNKQIKPELKPNQNMYQNYTPWTIQVIYRKEQKGNQQEGQIQVSQFETLGSVRQKCAATFGLEINEFHLRLKQGVVDPEEDDDSYVKDYGLSSQIFLLPNTNYDKGAHPKFLLALSQPYFDLLLNLLAQDDAGVVESVWTLLEKLPVNAKLQDDIINLRGTEDSWEGLLDSRSTHKLLYSLKIIEGLTAQNNDVANIQGQDGQGSGAAATLSDLTQWKQNFILKGGFEHLLNTFTGLKLETIDSKLTVRCIQSLLTTILDFVQLQQDLEARIFTRREAVVTACLRYLHLISLYSLLVEEQRGESLEDLKARQTQKRLAKLKMKQLQQVGPQRKNANQDNDSDTEQGGDELQVQISQVIGEFSSVRIITLKLFGFMSQYVFGPDNESRALVLKYPQLQELIEVSLLKTENYSLRMLTVNEIQGLLIACSQHPVLNQTLTSILHTMLFTLLPKAAEYEKRCGHFFSLLRTVISELKLEDLLPLESQLWSLAKSLTSQIRQWQITDVDSKNDENNVLAGWMGVLKVLMQKYPIRKKEVGEQLVNYLLEECLFKVPHGSGIGTGMASQPKCKSHASRQAALQLLAVLSRDCLQNLRIVLNYITEFSRSASWRTFKQSDWAITHQKDEKSSTGYVGLKNLGCICYMCSLFQQLFMIPSFREDLLSVDDPNHNDVEPDENMFYQLQAVFAGLQRSEKQYVNPKGFCHAYKDWDGNATNVMEQVDVEEFLSLFLDRLEAAIQQTPQEKTVQTHFGGKFAGQTICKGCPHSYEQRSEPFLSLSVPVKNKRSVQEGLTAFIQGEMLEGENAYFCEQCSKKVDALKRTCVKELPRYLILTLKRFEWDLDRGTRVKINDYCEFPLELDMLPYTQEGLSRKEKEAKQKQEAAEKGEEAAETEAEEPLKHDRKYYEFKLKGVVVHSGTADSGHYYSFIREPASAAHEKWYEFNDHIVRDFDIAELPKECFGGEDSFFGPGMMQLKTQKMRNAYVLLYERLGEGSPEADANDPPPKVNKQKDDKQSKLKLLDPDHPIQQNIMLENQKYWQNKYLFGTEYFDFVTELVNYWDTANIIPLRYSNKNQDEHIVGFKIERSGVDKSQLHQFILPPADQVYDLSTQHDFQVLKDTAHEVFKFTAKFFLTILQRSSLKGHVPRIVNAMKSYINYDKRNGVWLIEEFSNWYILEEMMFQVKNREMSKIICGLLYCSMLTVYEDEKQLIADYWPPTPVGEEVSNDFGVLGPLGNFVLLLLSNMYNMKFATINLPHFFRLLARFASLGPEAREFLLRAQIVGRCMDFYFDSASPYREEFSDMSSLGNIRVKEQPDIGLPTSLGQKIRGYFQVLQEKKRRQELIARPDTIRFNQLIELVSLCVQHIKLSESPYQLDSDYPGSKKSGPCSFFVNSKESDIFIPDARFLKRIFADAKKNRSMNALVKAHCHYASPDSDQVQELFKTVEFGINDSDFDNLRPFLFLLETLLETNHPTFEKRRASWLKKFLEIVKNNSSFYKWMETTFEFIFKIVGRNSFVREWFSQNTALWKFLIEWAQQNPKPPHPAQTTSTGTRLLKVRTNINIIQQYNDPEVAAKARLTASYRIRKLGEMMQNNVKDISQEVDTDKTDFLDFKFYPGDIIGLYSRKRDEASHWRVLVALDELLNIQCVQPDSESQLGQTKWQFCDTDKLLLGDIYRNLSRTQIFKELLERSQAQNQRLYTNNTSTGMYEQTQGSSGQQQRPTHNQLNDDLANVEDSNDEVESSDDTHNAVSNIVQ